jgi:hypothetical protein
LLGERGEAVAEAVYELAPTLSLARATNDEELGL